MTEPLPPAATPPGQAAGASSPQPDPSTQPPPSPMPPGSMAPGPLPPPWGGRPSPRAFAGGESAGAWVAGLVLIGIGALLLVGRWVPDAGQYVVLVVGLALIVVFAVTGQYGVLVPGGILTGIGAGVPLASAYPGQLGGGLFLIAMAGGFLLVWLLGLLFRLPEHHWWPVVPGLVLGSTGAALTAGERGQGISDAISTAWPAVLVVAGLALVAQGLRRRTP